MGCGASSAAPPAADTSTELAEAPQQPVQPAPSEPAAPDEPPAADSAPPPVEPPPAAPEPQAEPAPTGPKMDITDCWEAAREGDIDALKRARAQGVDLSKLAGLHNATVLHGAASAGSSDSIRFLCGEAGLPVDVKDEVSQGTALMNASEGHQLEAASLLLELGADIGAADLSGETALHRAAKAGAAECVALLLGKGAPRDARNDDGKTASELADALAEDDEDYGKPVQEAFAAA